jgi:hypothetical protein
MRPSAVLANDRPQHSNDQAPSGAGASAVDAPRLSAATRSAELVPTWRGLLHAYAFWVALVAVSPLVALASTPGARAAAGVYGAGLCNVVRGQQPVSPVALESALAATAAPARSQHDLPVHRGDHDAGGADGAERCGAAGRAAERVARRDHRHPRQRHVDRCAANSGGVRLRRRRRARRVARRRRDLVRRRAADRPVGRQPNGRDGRWRRARRDPAHPRPRHRPPLRAADVVDGGPLAARLSPASPRGWTTRAPSARRPSTS